MKKDSMFSLMSEQFKQARGRERLLCCGTSRALGELWPALAGATQGSINPWTDGQLLSS